MILQPYKTTTTNPANIAGGLLTVFSQVNDGATQEVVGSIQVTGRSSVALTEFTIRINKPLRYGEQTVEVVGVTGFELQLDSILWRAGETLTVQLLSDNIGDNAVTVVCEFFAETEPTEILTKVNAVKAKTDQLDFSGVAGALRSESIVNLGDVTGVGFGCPIQRSPTDTQPITFSFEGPVLTLTGTKSINNGAYSALVGTITFLRADGGVNFYTLSYNASDRLAVEGTITYRFVKTGWVTGDTERFVTLRIVNDTVSAVNGNVTGKVLGGGAGVISGTGVQSQLMTGAVTSTTIADGAITVAKIADNAITAPKIATDAITAAKIATDAITAAKIATGAFTSTKFAAGAFDAVWTVTTRTLTTVGDSAGVTTLLSRVTALLQTKAQADTDQATLVTEINANETKIDGIKAKTDSLTFTGSNLHVDAKIVSDKTGYSLTAGERTAIATAVEQAILDESDGQAILNAIVGAIGNQNIDQIALVAAIRADVERNGGMLDVVPTLAEIEASLILAKQSGFTGLATAANVTAAQTAIVAEIDANEVKIDGVKAKTDQFTFTLGNVNANSQVVSDKTGYGLADGAITSAKIATDAITAAKIASNAITDTKIATGAFTSAKFAAGAFDAVWTVTTRTLTTVGDSAGVATLLTRITALLETKAEADTRQTALVSEINQNEVKIDGVKAKTDQLQFTGANVNANAQVVSDKTGYGLVDGAITAAKIATDAITAAKIAADAITAAKIATGAFTDTKFAAGAFNAVWTVATRTLTATSDSAGVTTLLSRVTALLETKAEADTRQTALITEINQNEVKIDGVKAKTDQLMFTGANVNANSQVVSDKTDYGLADGAITATKIATGAFTSAKFAAGAFDAVWTVTTRTLTTVGDSAGVTTLLSRVTALIETKAEADTRQTALVAEINQNEVKIDGVKAKTDQLMFTGANVNANAQVVSDKANYNLADNAITAAKIATGALTDTKFASGAFNAVWTVATRTLTTVGDSAGVTTLLSRITGTLETKTEADARQTALLTAIGNIHTALTPAEIEDLAEALTAFLGSGDATAANQQIIIDALRRATKTQY
jgi:uncharacterized protein Yka (UPF0111/DUF47 family)